VLLQALKESDGQIGKVFLEKVDLFKVYAIYCSNQPMINARIREFEMKNKEFAKHLQVHTPNLLTNIPKHLSFEKLLQLICFFFFLQCEGGVSESAVPTIRL
jgi:hypothetical protein